MRAISYLLAGILIAIAAGGCAQSNVVQISAKPVDAEFTVDGVPRGRGPIVEEFTFDSSRSSHRVSASRLGYADETKVITRDTKRDVVFDLKPRTRLITFTVHPAPAM